MNENDIVARVRELFPQRGAKVGIGDDAAVIGELVVTTDMLVEDVDFTRETPIASIARKSLSVNLSDLAAMGALPAFGVVALALPPWVLPQLDPLLVALADAARQYDIDLVGGDLSRSATLTIAITAIGYVEGRPLLRSGARPGDRIYVSRPLGGSAAGLFLLQHGWSATGEPPRSTSYVEREFAASAIRHHLDPEPEIRLGRDLTHIPEVTACIDISDGLSTDLHHLCDASEVGADIERERIPVFPDLLGTGTRLGINTQDAVLHGGEELALLFTSSLRESELSQRVRRPVYAIGRVSRDRGVRMDGQELKAAGFDHFG